MKKLIISTTLLASYIPELLASNADNFREHDPWGWMMAVIAMGVVFSALLILFLCFKYGYTGMAAIGLMIMKGLHRKQRLEIITDKRKDAQHKIKESATGKEVNDEELAAAIGMALFLHEDGMHDTESGVLTLNAPQPGAWTGVGANQKQMPLRKF